jgi:hypothetical protein
MDSVSPLCCREHQQRFTFVNHSSPARQRKTTFWDPQVAVCRRLGLLSCGELGDRESLDDSYAHAAPHRSPAGHGDVMAKSH